MNNKTDFKDWCKGYKYLGLKVIIVIVIIIVNIVIVVSMAFKVII
jgi:hypothetical protein